MHPQSRISIASLTCTLADLTILSKTTGCPETIVRLVDPLLISVTVTLAGSGAIALLPLIPTIQVEFYARSLPGREELPLGTVHLPTQPHQFTYTPAIALGEGLAAVGASLDRAYLLSALVRVGAPNFPALVTGVIEGMMIQTYDD